MSRSPEPEKRRVTVDCTLVVNVGPRDHIVAARTLPHLIRTHKVEFEEICVVLDRKSTSGRLAGEPAPDSGALFQETLDSLPPATKVIEVDRSRARRATINSRWFGRSSVSDRCAGGTPIYPFVFGLDAATSRYRLHMDCDMLIHDPGPESWIQRAIGVLEEHVDILSVNQMMGPGSDTTEAPQFFAGVHRDRGLRLSQRFTSRCFFYDHQRLSATLPMQPRTHDWKKRLFYVLAGRGPYTAFEQMVEMHLHRTRSYRCDLDPGHGFSIHGWNKQFFQDPAIAETISAIEDGLFPPEQRGLIDLTRPWNRQNCPSA